jgi:hypothetical protein
VNPDSLAYLENMRVAQSRIYVGDVRWFVTSANGWVVRGPFETRAEAQDALDTIRELAFEEDAEDVA